jgi:cytochrome bd-I ubiquinol oxidase subunit X
MWYFSWILGPAFALAFGVVNAMWYESGEPDE